MFRPVVLNMGCVVPLSGVCDMTNFLECKSLKTQIKHTCTYNYFVSSIICIYEYYMFLIIIVVYEQIYFQNFYANCSEIISLKNRVRYVAV
jgi:hypothetical protein